MTTSVVDADSLLVLDIGSVTTRALLFDVVDGRYRFLASGKAPTSVGMPNRDIGEGVRAALDRLQSVTGRILVDANARLILPSASDGSGVDAFAATISAGPPLKIVALGLLEDVSLESACRLATTTYGQVQETISLNDRRGPEERLDAILRLRPDLVIAAGGSDGGASKSVLKLLETVGLAGYLLPAEARPEVLFAGNEALQDEVRQTLENHTHLHVAPNLRPALEVEQIEPARAALNRIYTQVRERQFPDLKELNKWSGGRLMSTAAAFGRTIGFLSKAFAASKGVLGIDLGASAATVAAAFGDDLSLSVYPELGLGSNLAHLFDIVKPADIARWLMIEASEGEVRDYVHQKALYPASLPATAEEMQIEMALGRVIMRAALRKAASGFPYSAINPDQRLLPLFKILVAAGSLLTGAPNSAQSLLMLLDGIQPSGVTTIGLDQNGLSAALGAAASVNPVLTVQVLDSSTFQYLGTVISPVANVRPGSPVLRVKITQENGQESSVDVKQGALDIFPLPVGQSANLHLQPLHRADIGMGGPGRGGRLKVYGGVLGLVIDARGRPLRLPEDSGRRRELFKKWLWTLGG